MRLLNASQNPPLDSGAELWDFLRERAKLEPEGWDEQLVLRLREALELPPEDDFHAALVAQGTSAQDVLLAFLRTLEPFAEMMTDLLALFERHGITTAGSTVGIVFDFDREHDLRFDLDFFRSQRTALRRAVAAAPVAAWTLDQLWDLERALREPGGLGAYAGHPDVEPWAEAYRGGSWPPPLEAPSSGHEELDARLEAVWRVWEWFLATARDLAESRDELRERGREVYERRNDPSFERDPLVELIAQVDSDLWLGTVAQRAYELAQAARTEPDGPRVSTAIADLDAVFAAVPTVFEQQLVDAIEEILDLPFWEHRYELYSSWILARLVATLEPADVVLCDDDGELRFAFKATRLASVSAGRRRLSVWAELRTALDAPHGKSRKGAIQPDYSVLVDAASEEPRLADSLLEIECKQYARSDATNFAHAIADYARGRPNAEIVLVNHGPINAERVLSRPEVRPYADRAHPIAELYPGTRSERDRVSAGSEGRRRFDRVVRDALWPALLAPVAEDAKASEPSKAPDDGALIRLRWAQPEDLDIHLSIETADGRHVISYQELGRLDAAPFAALEGDRQHPGEERLRIGRWMSAAYELAVNAYGNVPLAGSGGELILTMGRTTLTVRGPEEGAGAWWHVLRIDGATGSVEMVNQLRLDPPW